MKELIIKNDVLCYNVVWLLGKPEEIEKYIKGSGFELSKPDTSRNFSFVYNDVGYIYLNDNADYVLLHEIIHVVQDILDNKGIETGVKNTEILAYNVDWVYRKLFFKYYKYKKDNKWKLYK